MGEQGFAFSLEACLSLALLAFVILSFSPPKADSLDSLLLMQKGHDLLKAWNYRSGQNHAGAFERDFRTAFPGKQGRLEIYRDGVLLESIDFFEGEARENGSELAVEGLIFLDAFDARHFRLTIISP